MRAYKFLREGRVSPFAGTLWPTDEVVESDGGGVDLCRSGVHACRVNRLAYWLSDELWIVELDGEIVEDPLKLVAPRGRLVEQVEHWNDDAQLAFAQWCAAAAAGHAADELRETGLASAAELLAGASLGEIAAVATDAAGEAYAAGQPNTARVAEYAADAAGAIGPAPATLVAYIAAHTADARSGLPGDPFADERERQSHWLADHLGLSEASA
jgi:hypothetical protein